jgi:hypothetical protein
MFVISLIFQEEQTLTFILNQKVDSAEMKSHIQLLQNKLKVSYEFTELCFVCNE